VPNDVAGSLMDAQGLAEPTVDAQGMAVPPASTAPEVLSVGLSDPLVRPLLDDLSREYHARYAGLLSEDDLHEELHHYGAEEFAAPHGELILLVADGEAVAGGAFRLRTEPEMPDHTDAGVRTAELKRIWTHAAHRRRGLARRVLAELEARARARGYARVYLTTGPRQPEAVRLYLSSGYTPRFDPADPPTSEPLAFEKWLAQAG
jgi:GNAT superfamily N-acetyltransferase